MAPGTAITSGTFGHGTVNQRLAYLNLIQDIAHIDTDAMLQPAFTRTLDVALNSITWLAEGMAAGKFGHSKKESADFEAQLLFILSKLQSLSAA
jgi:hypothetical protein